MIGFLAKGMLDSFAKKNPKIPIPLFLLNKGNKKHQLIVCCGLRNNDLFKRPFRF